MNDETENYTKEELDEYTKENFAEMLEGEGTEGFDGVFDELYTVPQLREFAAKRTIDLQGRDKKADIIASVREWAGSIDESQGTEDTDVDGDATSDDTEEDSNDESDDVSELGDDSPSELEEDNVAVEELELHEALNAIQDEYKSAIRSLSRELDKVKADVKALQKALKCQPKGATLHGSIDSLKL